MPDDRTRLYFEVFNEIAIIEQLSRTVLEARLPDGLIAPHFTVLNHLTRLGDGRTPIDMARAFQVPKTSMTHTLKGLAARGLIDLRPNAEDKRSKRVFLTAAGRQLRDQVIADLAPDFIQMSEGFDMAKLAAIKPILTELRIFLDEDRNGRDQLQPDAANAGSAR